MCIACCPGGSFEICTWIRTPSAVWVKVALPIFSPLLLTISAEAAGSAPERLKAMAVANRSPSTANIVVFMVFLQGRRVEGEGSDTLRLFTAFLGNGYRPPEVRHDHG